jgi:hypothetical protein
VSALAWDQVLAWRMRRQRLDERAPAGEWLDVVASLCGLHAQVMSSAELTLWARVDGISSADVQRALWEERTLVKTWAMRGTLHLLPAAELGLWQAALSTYRHFERPSWQKAFGVTAEELSTLIDAVGRELDGHCLTREELAVAVTEETGSSNLGEALRESWGALLKPACFRGQLCFAPSDGQRVRFTHPASWLGALAEVDPDAALREVTRRYLRVYGPAVREDFARWWGGASAAQAQRLIGALGDEVVSVDVEGTSLWMLASDAVDAASCEAPVGVRLLPGFDQYVVSAPRAAVGPLLAPDLRPRVYRPQGWISPVLLVDGRMAGVWRHERRGSRVVVSVEPFGRLRAGVRPAVADEAERLAGFLGGALELSWA